MKIKMDEKVFDGLNMVFDQKKYLALAATLAILIGFFYAVSANLIYLQPIFFVNYYNLIDQGFVNFATGILFLTAVPIFASLTITILAYKLVQFRTLASPLKDAGFGTLGILAGLFTSTCSECVPLVLYSVGVSYSLFAVTLAPYIIWTRLLAILILGISFYYSAKEISGFCKTNSERKRR